MPTVAINGLGRIGRAALKILLDTDGLDLVAVNDIADAVSRRIRWSPRTSSATRAPRSSILTSHESLTARWSR